MWEISENLHRAELTTLDRSEQIAMWVRLSEGKVFLRQVAAKPGRPEGGMREAAREFGMDEKNVRRAVKIASISDEAKDAAAEAQGMFPSRSQALSGSAG